MQKPSFEVPAQLTWTAYDREFLRSFQIEPAAWRRHVRAEAVDHRSQSLLRLGLVMLAMGLTVLASSMVPMLLQSF